MQTVTFSEVQANLNAVMDRAAADHVPILITCRDGENVVMISASEWARIEERLYATALSAGAKHLL